MAGCQWVEHRGARILQVTYAGCRSDHDLLAVLAEQVGCIRAEGQRVRLLHDYRNVTLGEQFMAETIRISKEGRSQLVERTALVGLTGFRKALFHSYRLATGDDVTQSFESLDAALEWLVL